MVNQRGGVMNMKLSPPELGTMRIQMTINQGTVTAQFTVATEQARELLDRSLSMLRSSLESRGLSVERLGVQVTAAESSARNDGADAGEQRDSGESDHDAAEHQSRGRQEKAPGGGRSMATVAADFAQSFEAINADVEPADRDGRTEGITQ